MLDRSLFMSDVARLLDVHGSRLRGLCGQTLRASWVAWDEEDNEWLPDEAVILGVGSDNLEIVFWKLNEVALSWNCVDVTARPAWVADWGEERPLTWRHNGLPALASVVGKTVTGVSLVEYLFHTKVLRDQAHPENVGTEHEGWLLTGLELSFGRQRLQVFNALDENGVTLDPPSGPEFRRINL